MSCLPAALLLFAPLAGGCAVSPSLNVLGAFFPDWIFCMAGGVCALMLTRSVLLRKSLLDKTGPPLIVYPALAVIFSLAIWIVFFGG